MERGRSQHWSNRQVGRGREVATDSIDPRKGGDMKIYRLGAVLLATVLCFGAATIRPITAQQPTIILASGLASPYVQYPVAVEKGFFSKYGLRAELKVFSGGFAALQSVGAGAANLSNGSEWSFIGMRAKGANIIVVGRNIVNTSDLGVGAVKGIEGPKDLVGRRCATILGSAGDWYEHRYENVYHLKPDDIKIINLAEPEWIPAMIRGDIDCFFGWEPWLTKLPTLVSGAHVIHRNGQDKVYVLQNLVGFSSAWVKSDPASATKALRALGDTMQWVQNNRHEAAGIAAKAFQMEPAQLEQLMACCTYTLDFPQQVTDALADMAQWAASRKRLGQMTPDQLVSALQYPKLLMTVAPSRCTAAVCKGSVHQ